MTIIIQKALTAIKHPVQLFKFGVKQVKVLAKRGPVEYARYVARAISSHAFSHNFPNGIKTTLDVKKARNWYVLNRKHLVIILIGQTKQQLEPWMVEVDKTIHTHFLFTENNNTGDIDSKYFTYINDAKSSYRRIRQYLLRKYRGNDVFVVDLSQGSLPSAEDIIRMQHAAYTYDDDNNTTLIVQPSLTRDGVVYAGIEFNRGTKKFSYHSEECSEDVSQIDIPRYILTSNSWHGTYIRSEVFDKVSLIRKIDNEIGFGEQLEILTASVWNSNCRTLLFSPVRLEVGQRPVVMDHPWALDWMTNRRVVDEQGRVRVIYVLNATSVSGGIRVIFEHANGLIKRGFNVEIWSLQGQPTWMDVDLEVKQFDSYQNLMIALRDEDAIKVATWWETDQPVWLASVTHGIPVNFIQEFETWFYPNDQIAQAAVISSYRKEFLSLTTATYQYQELENIGINVSELIPVGYDESIYFPIKSAKRDSRSVLALGRSFFQKNFIMTLSAWRSIDDDKRPKMVLFGTEPDIVDDKGIEYHERPSNEEVNALYNTATCFVQTSIHEGFSLPVIEAMAAGCPVITTDSHGNRGFCHNEENCLMVEQNDVEGLGLLIERLISDSKLQAKLRKAGLQTAKQYRWSLILDDMAEFYRSAAKNN